jgi:protein SCO1/2
VTSAAIQRSIWVFLGSALVGISALSLYLHSTRAGRETAPALEGLNSFGAVPDFSLTERSGRTYTLADLRGKVWVANFVYTSCTDTCPLQSAEMAKLQRDFEPADDLRLVSITVDPERDTPAVLERYARRFGADRERWLFLTGGREEILRLAQEGFRLSAAPGSDPGLFLHSARFVLVDRGGEIRGYYDSREPAALERLRRDASELLAEGERRRG